MAVKSKKKKAKKVKYKKITFKLSESQKKIIDKYCKKHKTTSNKLIKKAIRDFILHHAQDLHHDDYVSKNQLKLFEEAEMEGREISEDQ